MPQRPQKSGRRRRTSKRPNDRDSRNRRRRAAATDPYLASATRRTPNPLVWIATLGLIAAGIFLIVRHNQSTNENGGSTSNATADGLLKEMQSAYKNLNAYSDTTHIQMRVLGDNGWLEEDAVINTDYLRPNLFRISAERPGTGVVIDASSDGENLRARIQDPGTANFDGQLVQQPAPIDVNVGTLYTATEYAEVSRPGQLTSLLTRLPSSLQISQLSALLDEQPFGGLLQTATGKSRLDDGRLGDTECRRVAIDVPDGQFVFWIDSITKLLRRVEFASPVGPDVRRQLTCDYSSISTEPALRDRFRMPVHDDAKVVRNFVLPASATPPKGLNQLAGSMSFTNLSNETVTSASFDGKIAVLCWFDSRPANQLALAKLQAVYDATSQDDAYQFLLVATDPTTAASHADIEQLLKDWKITMPVVRDLTAAGRDQFDIEITPTLIVIDDKGIVQLNETGIDPQLDEQLPGVLKLIADGKPIAADYVDFLKERQQAYEKQLAAASLNAPVIPATSLPTDILPATNPERLKLTKLWEQPGLKNPGNIYASVLPNDRLSVLVHDGWQSVVELDTDGKILRRHTVANTEDTAIQRLRSFTDRSGKRYYLGWSTLTRQVAVLDDAWETICVYPPVTATNTTAVQAADLADLDGDGQVELYVGFAPPSSTSTEQANYAGLHSVALDGQLRWKNERIEPVRSITRSVDQSGKTFLLTTNSTGRIVPVAADGTAQQPISVRLRAIHQLHASAPDDPNGVFCGITFLPNGEKLAIAIDGNLKDRWNITFNGTFRDQIEFTTTANWYENSPWWVIAGPDGSVSFVSHDGNFNERFQSGQELSGIATYKTRDANVLLLSGSDGVSAWKIEKNE